MNFDYKKLAEEMLKQMPGSYTTITLSEFCEQINSYAENNKAEKTRDGIKLVCKKLLNYFPPNRKLDSIELKDAELFLESLKKKAPKGIYNYHRTLRAIWNKAKQWNYIRTNPFEQVKLKKRQTQRPVFVTEQQLAEIVKHIESDIVREVVVTAFYTGCRLGEITNLKWKDVNLKDELLTIGNDTYETKTRKQRVVPLHPLVKKMLMDRVQCNRKREGENVVVRLPNKDRYVFGKGNGFKFTGDYFSRRFKRACRLAGIEEEIHFHCLRHGAATRMIMNGAPLPAVQKILGHSNIQTTMIYTHPDLESLREAVAKL